MTVGPIRFGLRTFKTALAVLLCILIFRFLERDAPLIACLAAVFAMRQDVSTTIHFGFYRLIANLLGGTLALFYIYIFQIFNRSFYVELLLIPLLVIFIIVFSDTLNFNPGIIGACATLFIIVLTVPENESFWYAISRVLDTVIGTVIALLVNRLILPPPNSAKPELLLSPEQQLINSQDQEITRLKTQLAKYEEQDKTSTR